MNSDTTTPIPTDPTGVYDFYLSQHHPLPPEARPVFVLKVLSIRERRKVSQALKVADDLLAKKAPTDEDGDKAVDIYIAELAKIITGWRNYPGEFKGVDSLMDVLQDADIMEFRMRLFQAQQGLAMDAKKKSGLLSPSSSKPAAPGANPVPSASTDPAPAIPSTSGAMGATDQTGTV